MTTSAGSLDDPGTDLALLDLAMLLAGEESIRLAARTARAAPIIAPISTCTSLYDRSLLQHRRRNRATDRLLPSEYHPPGRQRLRA